MPSYKLFTDSALLICKINNVPSGIVNDRLALRGKLSAELGGFVLYV
jgi:hypothetical protein